MKYGVPAARVITGESEVTWNYRDLLLDTPITYILPDTLKLDGTHLTWDYITIEISILITYPDK